MPTNKMISIVFLPTMQPTSNKQFSTARLVSKNPFPGRPGPASRQIASARDCETGSCQSPPAAFPRQYPGGIRKGIRFCFSSGSVKNFPFIEPPLYLFFVYSFFSSAGPCLVRITIHTVANRANAPMAAPARSMELFYCPDNRIPLSPQVPPWSRTLPVLWP